jgi:hypothetical protein
MAAKLAGQVVIIYSRSFALTHIYSIACHAQGCVSQSRTGPASHAHHQQAPPAFPERLSVREKMIEGFIHLLELFTTHTYYELHLWNLLLATSGE